MKEVEIDAYKRIPLEIMSEVAEFCEYNKINYSLAYGSLLGAVRHKGYIPWDDDIDIYMLREDYEKFRKMFNSPQYKIIDIRSNSNYPICVSKVYDIRTFYYFKNRIKRGWGLFIDIFVLDNIPDDNVERNKWFKKIDDLKELNSLKNSDFCGMWFTNGYRRRLKMLISRLIPVSSAYIHRKIEELSIKYNGLSTKFIASSIKKDHLYRREWFDNYEMLEFEGRKFKVSKCYDQILKTLYGDYMQLPPEEQRVPKHNMKAYYK